jgi:hypothetical protein
MLGLKMMLSKLAHSDLLQEQQSPGDTIPDLDSPVSCVAANQETSGSEPESVANRLDNGLLVPYLLPDDILNVLILVIFQLFNISEYQSDDQPHACNFSMKRLRSFILY